MIHSKATEYIASAPLEKLIDFVPLPDGANSLFPNRLQNHFKKRHAILTTWTNPLYEPIMTSIACSFNCIRAFGKEQKALAKYSDIIWRVNQSGEFDSDDKSRQPVSEVLPD